eukprot:TRINITY_DN2864_c0_g1_i1.p2 TRINITY_DN2864_c0_g1~~TRINITY_DN2864_c0_g1_i1.p2  ORF type:complete len:206 (+),score=2.01 TRINITY_DN2864_c0_g1_i1:503-1120(+)
MQLNKFDNQVLGFKNKYFVDKTIFQESITKPIQLYNYPVSIPTTKKQTATITLKTHLLKKTYTINTQTNKGFEYMYHYKEAQLFRKIKVKNIFFSSSINPKLFFKLFAHPHYHSWFFLIKKKVERKQTSIKYILQQKTQYHFNYQKIIRLFSPNSLIRNPREKIIINSIGLVNYFGLEVTVFLPRNLYSPIQRNQFFGLKNFGFM